MLAYTLFKFSNVLTSRSLLALDRCAPGTSKGRGQVAHEMTSLTRPPSNSSIRLGFYLCCAAHIIYGFGSAVGLMPWTRLIESVICRRHIGSTMKPLAANDSPGPSVTHVLLNTLSIGGINEPMTESQCKGDKVQAEMAEL